MNTKLTTSALIGGLALLIQGCAPSSYVVQGPLPSVTPYESNVVQQSLKMIDTRADKSQNFHSGVLNATLNYQGKAINEMDFLSEHTISELNARGVDLSVSPLADTEVNVEKLSMRNHRTNGFTPFITFTMLKANVNTKSGIQPIAVYVKRGKVPVWSFDEVVAPTFNEPLSLLVKEFSAKLNMALYKQQTSDEKVDELIAKIKAKAKDGATYLDVYELGFSNNKRALPFLRSLTQATNPYNSEYNRLAAISSLGILKDENSIDSLKDIAENAKTWSDRAMALKALGDIGSAAANDYLKQKHQSVTNAKTKEELWNKELIELYL